MTTGSSGGFLLSFLAAFDAGDTVAMARPGYPAYRNVLAALGCRVLELPCGAQRSLGRNSIVVNSFSKYFSMTGWRIGWLLVPDELLDAVDRLAGNFAICPPALSQHAATAAFDAYDELDANVARYAGNRRRLLEQLPAIGLDRLAPADGAFYVYADVSRWTDDSHSFASRLLAETGVAVAPGVDFDPVEGGRFIRMCFAGDAVEIQRGVELLGDWLARRPAR